MVKRKRILRIFWLSAAVAAACLTALYSAQADMETLKARLDRLETIPLPYGPTQLKVNNRDVIIVRGKFENGNAWGGDLYTVLVRQPGDFWLLVRHRAGGWKSVLTATRPHLRHDSIETVRFLVPKGTAAAPPELYLLQTERTYKFRPEEEAPARFTLSVMEQENGPDGVRYFRRIDAASTQDKYCNADWAAFRALGLPLRGEEGETSCAGPPEVTP